MWILSVFGAIWHVDSSGFPSSWLSAVGALVESFLLHCHHVFVDCKKYM